MFFNIAYATSSSAPGVAEAVGFVAKFNDVILYPLIVLLTAVALLVFLYGGLQYIANSDQPTAREEGRKHIMWGIVGLLVMLTAFAILSVAANTFGLKGTLDCAKDPSASGCGGSAIPVSLPPLPADPGPIPPDPDPPPPLPTPVRPDP